MKVLSEKIDSKINQSDSNEFSQKFDNISMFEQRKLIDRVEWLTGECELLNEQCLRQIQEYANILNNVASHVNSIISQQITNLREDYETQLQEVRGYIGDIEVKNSHIDLSRGNCTIENTHHYFED